MNVRRGKFLLLLLPLLTAGCGSPGIPLPPSLELARPISDLSATRKGNRVVLTWSVPTLTTDRRNLRRGGTVEICRALDARVSDCKTPIGHIGFQEVPAKSTRKSENYSDEFSPSGNSGHATSYYSYAVRILNPYGRSAGISNQVQIPAAPVLNPPLNLRADLTGEGVRLSWNPVTVDPEIPDIRFIYRIYRREERGTANLVAGEVAIAPQTATQFLDSSFEWEKTYDYHAAVVTVVTMPDGTQQQVEGDDSASVKVFAHDVFPPGIPTGLQAGFSGPGQKMFIDVVWTPNTEADLAGYNLYRHEPGSQPVKINFELVKSPSFRDFDVRSGQKYFYSIIAVDVRGNESQRSDEASESIP